MWKLCSIKFWSLRIFLDNLKALKRLDIWRIFTMLKFKNVKLLSKLVYLCRVIKHKINFHHHLVVVRFGDQPQSFRKADDSSIELINVDCSCLACQWWHAVVRSIPLSEWPKQTSWGIIPLVRNFLCGLKRRDIYKWDILKRCFFSAMHAPDQRFYRTLWIPRRQISWCKSIQIFIFLLLYKNV